MSHQYQYIVARQRIADLHREAERARLSADAQRGGRASQSGDRRRLLRHVSAKSAHSPLFSFAINPSLKPTAKQSHLGSVLGPDGSQLDFRTGVLVVGARRSSDVRSLLKRWRGRVLERIGVAHPGKGRSST